MLSDPVKHIEVVGEGFPGATGIPNGDWNISTSS